MLVDLGQSEQAHLPAAQAQISSPPAQLHLVCWPSSALCKLACSGVCLAVGSYADWVSQQSTIEMSGRLTKAARGRGVLVLEVGQVAGLVVDINNLLLSLLVE